ncbi:MAG: hypothetical protein ACOVQT_01640 [Rubrivivax sp.]|jgi:hypothetical protein
MARAAAMVALTALCGTTTAAPVSFLHTAAPNVRVDSSGAVTQAFDLTAWARQHLGTDAFRVTGGRLRLDFSDDTDPLTDLGLLGYGGQTQDRSAYRGTRDGRSGVITQEVVTTWQTRGWEDAPEQAWVEGIGLQARVGSGSRQANEAGPSPTETGRAWSGWTCRAWGCSGTETIWREGERYSVTRYDGAFGVDLALGPLALEDLSRDGRWSFSVGAALGDFLWRGVRLDLTVEALPPTRGLPVPGGLALAAVGLVGLAWARRRRAGGAGA